MFTLGDPRGLPRPVAERRKIAAARPRPRFRAPDEFEVEVDEAAASAPTRAGGYREGEQVAVVERPSGRASIRWEWARGAAKPTLFVIGLLVSLATAYAARFFVIELVRAQPRMLFAVTYVILACALGVGALALLWGCIAAMCNSTRVSVEDGILRVEHGPIPWPGGKRLYASDIEQLWCERYEYEAATTRRGVPIMETAYRLMAAQKRGEPVTLLDRLAEPKGALYIEQVVEHALGIEDAAISGELPRPAVAPRLRTEHEAPAEDEDPEEETERSKRA